MCSAADLRLYVLVASSLRVLFLVNICLFYLCLRSFVTVELYSLPIYMFGLISLVYTVTIQYMSFDYDVLLEGETYQLEVSDSCEQYMPSKSPGDNQELVVEVLPGPPRGDDLA